jgi:predicted small secreted protein
MKKEYIFGAIIGAAIVFIVYAVIVNVKAIKKAETKTIP